MNKFERKKLKIEYRVSEVEAWYLETFTLKPEQLIMLEKKLTSKINCYFANYMESYFRRYGNQNRVGQYPGTHPYVYKIEQEAFVGDSKKRSDILLSITIPDMDGGEGGETVSVAFEIDSTKYHNDHNTMLRDQYKNNLYSELGVQVLRLYFDIPPAFDYSKESGVKRESIKKMAHIRLFKKVFPDYLKQINYLFLILLTRKDENWTELEEYALREEWEEDKFVESPKDLARFVSILASVQNKKVMRSLYSHLRPNVNTKQKCA